MRVIYFMDFKVLDNKFFSHRENFEPIFSVIKEIGFGVKSNGNWLKISSAGLCIFEKENYDSSLLTLLKFNFKILEDKIQIALNLKNLPSEYASKFPYDLVILNGLRSKSEYWINLSLDWLGFHKNQENDNHFVDIFK